MRETRLVSALEQPLPGKGLAPPPGEQGSHPSAHCGLKSRPLPSPRRAGLRPVRPTAVPYAGDGRSAGGRCRSRARGGTESSRLGPEVRTPSAPPLCREQSWRMSSERRDAPRPGQPSQTWAPAPLRRAAWVAPSAKWRAQKVEEELSVTEQDPSPASVILSRLGPPPGVQEDELHVQAGAEHEHIAVQLDLRDGAGRQRVAHGHQAHVLVAAIEGGHVQAVLADLQVAAAVNDLQWRVKGGGETQPQPGKVSKKVGKGLKYLATPGGHKGRVGLAPALRGPKLLELQRLKEMTVPPHRIHLRACKNAEAWHHLPTPTPQKRIVGLWYLHSNRASSHWTGEPWNRAKALVRNPLGSESDAVRKL